MNKKISLSLITALCLTSLNAVEFKPVGYKAIGMGGTGVASSRGSLAGYYNPALVRFSDYTTEFSLDIGARVRESNLIDNMDKLSDIDYQTTIDNIANNADTGKKTYTVEVGGSTYTLDTSLSGTSNSQTDRDNVSSAIDIITKQIGTDNAFQVGVTPSFSAQISDAFAVGVYANVDIGFRLNIDGNYDRLITKNTETIGGQNIDIYYEYNPETDIYSGTNSSTDYENHSLEYANDNDINYIAVDAIALAEVPLSYARAYDWNSGTWSFGINLKPMTLVTYTDRFNLGESSDDVENSSDDATNETTYKSTIGVDLGIAYRPKDSKMTLGLVGKNINSPKFKVDESKTGITEDFTIDPLFRAGLSVPIWNDNVEFALDADLSKNDTLVEGEQSQFFGAGIELHPASWFALRIGAMQDMASEKFDDGTIMTAGLGIGLKWAQIDLSAMMSTNTGTYDGEEIPRYAAVNVAIVSRWGDGYNRKAPPAQ